MTKNELIKILAQIPDDAALMSNSGWECGETEMDGVWYNAELNEVHFTQGGEYERNTGYSVERYCEDLKKVRIYRFDFLQ